MNLNDAEKFEYELRVQKDYVDRYTRRFTQKNKNRIDIEIELKRRTKRANRKKMLKMKKEQRNQALLLAAQSPVDSDANMEEQVPILVIA